MPVRTPRRRRAGRTAPVLALLLVGLALVAGRVVWLQTLAAPAYAGLAEEQRLRDIELSPRRGDIYDREGQPLAVTSEARTVYANPQMIGDPAGVAEAVADALGGDAKDYEARLRKDRGFVYLGRKVGAERAQTLKDLKVKGIGFIDDYKRTYPSGELACQVLGFVGVDDDGLAGLEKEHDALLAGEPGRLLAERDPSGRPIPGGVQVAEDPVDGQDIILTIDKDIQFLAQIELAAAVEKWGAKSGSVVVMDPRNGEILALASVPGFDPNAFGRADPRHYRNRPVTDAYEPGSTMKVFTAAAAFSEGVSTPEKKYVLPSTIKVGGRVIKESHPRGTVTWSAAEIVANSSNVGAVLMGQALGRDRLYGSFLDYGFGQRTGIDLPGEAAGYLPPPRLWSASSIGNIPFGQGISVTPLQLARAMCVVANGGELVTPHVLMDVPDRDDAVPARPRERVLEATVCAQVGDALRSAVSDGTGEAAAVAGYEVAGKTGTAQKPRSDGQGYKDGGYVASFAGYIPADAPRFVIVVIVDDPRGAIYGGVVAAPVFREIAAFSVAHMKVPPASRASTGTSAPVSGQVP